MHRIVLASLCALALVPSIPLALGDTCLPTCDVVTAGSRVFVPALSVVDAGSTLSWRSGDNDGHTATDLDTFCFSTGFGTTLRGSVRFLVEEGLLATSVNGQPSEVCAVAPGPDGSFLLHYVCLLHPEMQGDVLVRSVGTP